MPDPRPSRAALLALSLVALLASGCITRTVRETLQDDGRIRMFLRSERRGSTPVERGFEHPLQIASVRLAHILASLDLQEESGKRKQRRPAIPTQNLHEVARALAKGLSAAGPDQEVVLQLVRREKHLVLFDRHYLTSLAVHGREGSLHIQVARSDWEIPERRRDQLPEPRPGERSQRYRLLASDGIRLADPQTAVVEWRHPVFARPSRIKTLPSGRILRKTILMESGEEGEAPAPADATEPPATP